MLSCISCIQLCAPYGLWPTRLLGPWDSPGKNTGVGCHALLHGIFVTQGPNSRLSRLLHWQVGSLPLAPSGKQTKCPSVNEWIRKHGCIHTYIGLILSLKKKENSAICNNMDARHRRAVTIWGLTWGLKNSQNHRSRKLNQKWLPEAASREKGKY